MKNYCSSEASCTSPKPLLAAHVSGEDSRSFQTQKEAPFGESYRRGLWLIFVLQIILLSVVGFRNREYNDNDGGAFVRIAHYYATGNTHLMVAGYFTPLLSWLMVPWLWMGMTPFTATRVAVGVSAVIFQIGCLSLFRAFGMSSRWQLFGCGLVALATVPWSVLIISPDMLLCGLMCLAISRMVRADWLNNWKVGASTGCIWGFAYLAKAVALPLALGTSIGFTALNIFLHTGPRRQIVRQFALTLAGFSLIAGPWILALSLEYKKFTFSESAPIALSIIGPPDVDRYHPIGRILFKPEPGRVTAMEDASRMPYNRWSPLQSKAYALHYLRYLVHNAWSIWCALSNLDPLCLGLISALSVPFLAGRTWRQWLRQHTWAWGVIPLGCVLGLYWLVYGCETRYYYITFPIFLAMFAGLQRWLADKFPTHSNHIRRTAVVLIIVSFAFPALGRLPAALAGHDAGPYRSARILSERLRANRLDGPLIGMPRNLAPDWVAILADQPWYGAPVNPQVCRESGAALLLVERGTISCRQYEQEEGFENLDSVLFKSTLEANNFPVKVFKIIPHAAALNAERP